MQDIHCFHEEFYLHKDKVTQLSIVPNVSVQVENQAQKDESKNRGLMKLCGKSFLSKLAVSKFRGDFLYKSVAGTRNHENTLEKDVKCTITYKVLNVSSRTTLVNRVLDNIFLVMVVSITCGMPTTME
ncbi:hypothetical protein PR048_012707 [Dryococelus australis]|uniref:Uncharacterized protein n=1 Tax=Dryococelus australis TaxID=614101 RepID=A0ABQ9HQ92_9NEOP|nr:hypothetical protein PR048_012707 [Dryococelus australis]